MSKKYKELPAFETNEFKVGDRVRAYHIMGRVDGVVLSVYKFTLNVGKNINSGLDFNTYNFKACRKLVQIEPREFYIGLDSRGVTSYVMAADGYTSDRLRGINYQKLIKVREVLED